MKLPCAHILVLLALVSPLCAQEPSPLYITDGESCGGAPPVPAVSDARDPIYYPGDTEHLKPLGKKLLSNVWLDQKQIWTSPFRMNRHNAGWWLVFGGATAALLATDHRTANALENAPTQVRVGNDISKIGSAYTVVPIAAGFYLTGVLADNPKARETGILSMEAMLDAIVVYEVTKSIASRNRPNSTKEAGHFFSGGSSFPSGHAMTSWAFASVVAHEYSETKFVPVIAYGLATLVSGARFAARQHYASDIVIGAAAGWFIGTYVYHTHEDHRSHTHDVLSRLAPDIRPSIGTYAVSLNLKP
jgi:membrane-associated phospholipid phosphatase